MSSAFVSPPKNIPRGAITEHLVEPFKLLLNALTLNPVTRLALEEAYRKAHDQQALLNDKLEVIMAQLGILEPRSAETLDDTAVLRARLDALQARVDLLEDAADPEPTTDTVSYEFPVQGPTISISGTSFLAITGAVAVDEHEDNVLLAFWWSATNSGVDAQWRLKNRTTGDVLLEGTEAAPFARTLVLVTDAVDGLMPQAGDEVALEVCFSGTGSGGEIELTGPATWGVV